MSKSPRWDRTSSTAASNSSATQQLTPSTSSSLKGSVPEQTGALAPVKPTTTTRPPFAARSRAVCSTSGRPVVSMMVWGPAPPRRTSSDAASGVPASNPARATRSRREATGSTSVTRPPRSRAAIAVANPIGPAPNTTTCSAARTPARATVWMAMETGSTSAVCAGSRSPAETMFVVSTSTRSCRAPSWCTPIRSISLHTFGRAAVHDRQRPHPVTGQTATRSPISNGEPAGSTASTTAENSWP